MFHGLRGGEAQSVLSLNQPHWELTKTPLLPFLGPPTAESGLSF